jgi:histidine ammonia-lyase
MILDNARKVIAIELFAASQALWLRGEDKLAPATKAVYDHIRTQVSPIEDDIVMHYPMVACEQMVKNHEISAAAEAVCGALR